MLSKAEEQEEEGGAKGRRRQAKQDNTKQRQTDYNNGQSQWLHQL